MIKRWFADSILLKTIIKNATWLLGGRVITGLTSLVYLSIVTSSSWCYRLRHTDSHSNLHSNNYRFNYFSIFSGGDSLRNYLSGTKKSSCFTKTAKVYYLT